MKKKKMPAPSFLVSQSMIKDLRRYVAKKLCGLVLEAKYISKTWPVDGDDSPAKKLGRYFEFILTGALPRNGLEPQAEYTAAGMKKDPLLRKTNDMMEPYKLAHINATRVKRYFKLMKIKVIQFGIHITKGGKEGTIDIIALYNGTRVVIDVKYSGLIDDKWNELGWEMTSEQKIFHGTQGLQYHYLAGGIPFYFLVVSSKNEKDIKFIELEFDDFSKEQHDIEVNHTRKKMLFGKEFGFTPYPELVRCMDCAIKEGCAFKIEAPVPVKVFLGSDN